MAIKKGGFAKPVDIDGIVIKGTVKAWKAANPRRIYFDSKFEWQCYKLLKEAGFNFDFHPPTRELVPAFPSWALSKGKGVRKLFKSTVRSISYTTDFAVHCNDGTTVFIEAKGFFHKDARLRYKLFQQSLAKDEISLLAFDKQNDMKDMKAIIKLVNEDFGGSAESVKKLRTSKISEL